MYTQNAISNAILQFRFVRAKVTATLNQLHKNFTIGSTGRVHSVSFIFKGKQIMQKNVEYLEQKSFVISIEYLVKLR